MGNERPAPAKRRKPKPDYSHIQIIKREVHLTASRKGQSGLSDSLALVLSGIDIHPILPLLLAGGLSFFMPQSDQQRTPSHMMERDRNRGSAACALPHISPEI